MKSYSEHGTLQFYKSFRICSDHFDPKDILFDGRKKRLLQTAVPQFFLRQKPIIASPKKAIHDINSNNMFKFKLVQNLCRLCAKENRNLTDIFEGQGKTLNLEKKLKYFPLVVGFRKIHKRKISRFNERINYLVNSPSKIA